MTEIGIGTSPAASVGSGGPGGTGLLRPLPRGPRALLAFSMSLVCPGWGQLYAGEDARAFGALALFAFGVLPGSVWLLRSALVHPGVAPLVWLAVLLLALLVPLDAARRAWRRTPRRGDRLLRAGALVGFLVLGLLCLQLEVRFIGTHWLGLFRTPTISMLPNLVPGDVFLVDVRRAHLEELALGDVIVFESGGVQYTKRVVGLPGMRVAMEDGRLLVNGAARTDAEGPSNGLRHESLGGHDYPVYVGDPDALPRLQAVHVPPDSVFVLGDNRVGSEDSRHFGPVSADRIRGRVLHVIWSYDVRSASVRWNRIGRSL